MSPFTRRARWSSCAAALALTAAGAASAQALDFERGDDFGNNNFGAGYAFGLGFAADAAGIDANGFGNVYARIFGQRGDIIDASTSAGFGGGVAAADASVVVLGQESGFALATDGIEVNLYNFEHTFVSVSTTISIGPIPVNVGADVTGNIGIDGEAALDGGTLEATLTPYVDLTGTASATVGIACANAGIEGEVSLVDASAPLGAVIDSVAEEIALSGELIVSTLAGTIRLVASWCVDSASLDLVSWPAAAELVVPIIEYTYGYGDNPQANCPAGAFDGRDCVVGTALDGTTPMIVGDRLMTTAVTHTHCPTGTLDNGRCYVASAPAGTRASIRNQTEMWSTKDPCGMGIYDGADCHVATPPPGTHAFLYYGGLYVTDLPGDVCPIGNHDGANCYLGHPPAGTHGFIRNGDLYTTTLATPVCRQGQADVSGCYLGYIGANARNPGIVEANHFYVRPTFTDSCPMGGLTWRDIDGTWQPMCDLGGVSPGVSPWIRDGRDLMTTSLYARSASETSDRFGGAYGIAADFDASRGWNDSDVLVRRMGDVNGDGNADIVGFGTWQVYVFLADGQGGFTFAPGFTADHQLTTSYGWGADHPRELADVNGDGHVDLVGFGDGAVMVKLSTGQGFQPAQVWSNDCVANGGWNSTDDVRTLADVDGDGNADIVCIDDDSVWVGYSDGQRFGPLQVATHALTRNNGGWNVQEYPRMLADVNRDGRADLVGFGWGAVYVALSAGDGFLPPVYSNPGMTVRDGWSTALHQRTLADVDGDGLTDLVGFGGNDVFVATSNGDGTFTSVGVWSNGFAYDDGWRVDRHFRGVADIDGDGDADIVALGENSGWNTAALSLMPGE